MYSNLFCNYVIFTYITKLSLTPKTNVSSQFLSTKSPLFYVFVLGIPKGYFVVKKDFWYTRFFLQITLLLLTFY